MKNTLRMFVFTFTMMCTTRVVDSASGLRKHRKDYMMLVAFCLAAMLKKQLRSAVRG